MKLQHSASRLHRNVFVKQVLDVGAFIVCFSAVMLFLLGGAHIVQGQSMSDSMSYASSDASAERASEAARTPLNSNITWRENFGKQSALSLRLPSAAAKEIALQNLIIFATNHGDELDLSDAVPALLRIYEGDSRDHLQIMALVALQAIGDEDGMERVLELFADARFRRQRISPRLRHMTHVALSEYLQSQGS